MMMISGNPKNNYTKKTTKLLLFSIFQCNLSKFITQTGLYCSKQLETTFHQFCEKPLHITVKVRRAQELTEAKCIACKLLLKKFFQFAADFIIFTDE